MSNKSLTPGELKNSFKNIGNNNNTSYNANESSATTPTTATPVATTPVANTTTATTVENKTVVQSKIVTGRDEGLESKVTTRLNAYKESTTPTDKAFNLAELIKLIDNYPKNSVLNTVLAFFKENKDEEFLDEMHALQGIEASGENYVNKIRVLYDVMMKFAKNEASTSTINIGVLRNVFKNDIANWVAFKLSSIRRR